MVARYARTFTEKKKLARTKNGQAIKSIAARTTNITAATEIKTIPDTKILKTKSGVPKRARISVLNDSLMIRKQFFARRPCRCSWPSLGCGLVFRGHISYLDTDESKRNP